MHLLKENKSDLNFLVNQPLVYQSSPLCVLRGEISTDVQLSIPARTLLDTGASTNYISKKYCEQFKIPIQQYLDQTIQVRLGDNEVSRTKLEIARMSIRVSHDHAWYHTTMVVYQIPDEFDCILGMPFFEEANPIIDWKARAILPPEKMEGKLSDNLSRPIEEGSPVYGSELPRAAQDAKALRAISQDSCRTAVPVSDVRTGGGSDQQHPSGSKREQLKQKLDEQLTEMSRSRKKKLHLENMFTMGIVSEDGIETKFITQKKLKKFLKIKCGETNDFLLVLTNESIKEIQNELKRQDEPDNVGTQKAKRYLDTDYESFRGNPAFDLVTEFRDSVFQPELPDGLPTERPIEHRIDIKDKSIAMYRQQWRLSPEQKEEVEKWVREMVRKGLIRPSISPHAAPTFCVRKPVGWRIVHDYRQLNSNTIRQSIPMTRKEDVFDAMAGGYYFSTMDLMSAYYQVRMREQDIKYTAFQAPSGLWEYLVLPMGVSNAPATMHRLTSELFKGLPHTRSFYDDIYVFTKSKSIQEHLDALRQVLTILQDNKLYVKLAKCVFCAEEIPCLGDFIGRNGVRIDPDKVRTIRDWPIPRNQDELHSFLGLTGYVQRFCHQYADLTAPLFDLLKKKDKRNAKISLNSVQLQNFKKLKQSLTTTPVLSLPDFSKPMHIRTDASNFAIGGVLFQLEGDVERPIAFTSRKMKSAELNYPTQQQELLAIVHTLSTFRIYCVDHPPIVETDHKSLEGIFTQKMANRRLARWYDLLAEFQPIFSYLPGHKNTIADTLSRRPDLKPNTKAFHDLSISSFNETGYLMTMSTLEVGYELKDEIKKAYSSDRETSSIIKSLANSDNSPSQKKYYNFTLDDGFLWYQTKTDMKPRLVVPNNAKVKRTIIGEAHDTNYGGHPGYERTYLNLRDNWYWNKMTRSIKSYIADCESCSRNKPRLSKPPGHLEPLQIPQQRWRDISMDFILELPKTKKGFNSIWVVVDRLTKRTHFVATTKDVTATGVAEMFMDHIWRHHGMPESIVSDRDTKFTSKFWTEVFKVLGTKLKMTVSYRPQGDGQTERQNRTLEEYLRCFVNPLQDDWDQHLPMAEFAINSTVNSSIKMSPFEADLGYVPRNPIQLSLPKSSFADRTAGDFYTRQAAILKMCQDSIAIAQARMRDAYNCGRPIQEFSVGDKVYLSTANIDPKHTGLPSSSKLGPKWIGPYSVVQKVHNTAYKLNIPPGCRIHPVFNTGALKPYNTKKRLSKPHDVVLKDGTIGQLVQRICKKRRRKNKIEYLVQWVGESKPTWEPLENLSQVTGLIQDFENKPKRKRRRK